jgi:hypothetical protein
MVESGPASDIFWNLADYPIASAIEYMQKALGPLEDILFEGPLVVESQRNYDATLFIV